MLISRHRLTRGGPSAQYRNLVLRWKGPRDDQVSLAGDRRSDRVRSAGGGAAAALARFHLRVGGRPGRDRASGARRRARARSRRRGGWRRRRRGVHRPGLPGRRDRDRRDSGRARRECRGHALVARQFSSKWDFIGPDTLDVDRLGTQSFIKPTQWSGRVTALTVDPKCKPQECTLYVGAAGGGVWRTKNALAQKPAWKQISDGIPTNAIGSIAVDPNDPTGKTVYVGPARPTRAATARPASASTRRPTTARTGRSSPARSPSRTPRDHLGRDRAGQREPHPDRHPLRRARHRLERDKRRHGRGAVAGGRPLQLDRRRRDVRAGRRRLVQRGQVRPERPEHDLRGAGGGRPDPLDGRRPAGSWQTIFAGNRGRYSFSPVRLPNGKTRIYLADASGGGRAARRSTASTTRASRRRR